MTPLRRRRIAVRLALIVVLLVGPVWAIALGMQHRDNTVGSLG